MTDFGFGVLIGASGMFIAGVALILFITRGPGEKVRRYTEGRDE